jgi:hypothetical protein
MAFLAGAKAARVRDDSVSIAIDQDNLADDLALVMIADILESWSIEEIRQLVEEMEADLGKLH